MSSAVPDFVAEAATWTEAVAWWTDRHEVAVALEGTTWSGAELVERAMGAAEHLEEIAPGEGAIPALFTATPGAFAYLVGAPAAGRPIAPLGPRLTAAELAPSITTLGAEVLLTDEAFGSLATELSALTGVAVEVVATPPRSARPMPRDLDPSSVAFVLHTSGTTGQPTPVPFSQARLAERVRVNARLFGMGPTKVFSSASPVHHIAGFGSYAVALASGTAVVPMARFTPEAWVTLAEHHVTHVVTVPTILELLLEAGVLDLPGLELLQYGASPMHPSTLARVMALVPHVDLLHLYGQTEGSPITVLSPEDHRAIATSGRVELLESVGRAVDVVELRLDEVDHEGVGEVVARAAHFSRPGPDGWLHTGDLGRLDDEGYLFLAGRKGDMIIRGGENVYPIEVEQVLETHPGVREAAVIGIKDVTWGETLRAVIVPSDPAAPPSLAVLRDHARAHLAGFKVPTEVAYLDVLPRNASGKLLRRALKPSS